MKKYSLGVFLAVVFVLLISSAPVLAQEPTPDYQATADAASRRAQSAQATAGAARVQAMAQAATATAQVQQTATAQSRATAQAATATSAQATAQVQQMATGQARATATAGAQATATAQSFEATYQAGAVEIQASEATAAAFRLERERLAMERAQAWQPVITYAGWAALAFAVVFAVIGANRLIDWGIARRRRGPERYYPPMDAVVDGEFAEGPGSPTAVAGLLPARSGLVVRPISKEQSVRWGMESEKAR
jgi:hypothetical protein